MMGYKLVFGIYLRFFTFKRHEHGELPTFQNCILWKLAFLKLCQIYSFRENISVYVLHLFSLRVKIYQSVRKANKQKRNNFENWNSQIFSDFEEHFKEHFAEHFKSPFTLKV